MKAMSPAPHARTGLSIVLSLGQDPEVSKAAQISITSMSMKIRQRTSWWISLVAGAASVGASYGSTSINKDLLSHREAYDRQRAY